MIDWTKKLAAWLHDPAEKQLILMRDREGHEFGTVKRLREKLLKQSKAVSKMIVTVWGMGYKFSPNDDRAADDKQ